MAKKNRRGAASKRKQKSRSTGSSKPNHAADDVRWDPERALEFLKDPKNAEQIAKAIHPSSTCREDPGGPLFVDPHESLLNRSPDGWANACTRWEGLTTELMVNTRLTEEQGNDLRKVTEEIAFQASRWGILAIGLRSLGGDLRDLATRGGTVELPKFLEHMKAADIVVAEVMERSKAQAMERAVSRMREGGGTDAGQSPNRPCPSNQPPLDETEEKLLKALQDATSARKGRTLRQLVVDLGLAHQSSVDRAIRRLQELGYPIENRGGARGYYLAGERVDGVYVPKRRGQARKTPRAQA